MPWSETSQGRDAASWATLVVLIACLDWAMKVVLLVRQRRLSRSKAVPVVLTSTVTPDEFRFSAQRFQRIFAAQLGHANLVLNTIVCSLQFNLLPIAWNWAGLLVRPDQPQAAFRQSLVWLALLQLLRSVPRTLMYIDECWRVGLARRPSLAAFFLDRTTVAAILVLGAVRIVGATRLGTWPLQSGTIAMADAVAACVIPTVAFFLNVPLVPLTQTRAPTEAPIATSSHDSDEKHPVHPTELVQLTTDEAEAIRMYERGSKTSMLAQRTVFVLNLVFTVLFVQLVNHNPLFLRAFGFGAAEQGTPAVIDAPPLVVGSALATLLLRPLLVAARLQLNFLSRRAVCAQDRYV